MNKNNWLPGVITPVIRWRNTDGLKFFQKYFDVFTEYLLIDDLKQRTKNIAENFGVNIINQECDIRPYTYPLFSKTFKPIWLSLSIV